MPDFVTLTCPSCGGKLEITNDIDRFACGHCGAEHIVRRSGGIVSLAPVVAALGKVQVGVDKTAAELAIVRLKEETEGLQRELDQANKQDPLAGGVVALVLGAFGLLLFFTPSGTSERSEPCMPCLAISAVLIIIGLTMVAQYKSFRDNRARLQSDLGRTRAELSKYERIVRN
jgi:hypothetical protein